jgi:anthranilate/para-aminobenzoate synthase component I
VITELEFKSLASQGYNRIPLMLEAFADLETPLSLYLKLAHTKDNGKYSFLLESVVGGERFGRYSFIGLPARTLLRASGFGADAKTEVVPMAVVRDRDGQPARISSSNTKSVSRWPCARACPVFVVAWRATLVTTRCATSRKNSKKPARPIPWAHPTSCCCSAKNWLSLTTCRASST